MSCTYDIESSKPCCETLDAEYRKLTSVQDEIGKLRKQSYDRDRRSLLSRTNENNETLLEQHLEHVKYLKLLKLAEGK